MKNAIQLADMHLLGMGINDLNTEFRHQLSIHIHNMSKSRKEGRDNVKKEVFQQDQPSPLGPPLFFTPHTMNTIQQQQRVH